LLAILAIAGAGLILRLLGARGDLWQDEIWTLTLVEPLTSIDQIFWRVNHDNNHFLNSIYLYLIGPDASPLVQRGLSILLGLGTIFAAAMAAAPRGRGAMVVASLLFSVSYPMVHFGSEARGYAGLILFSLLSLAVLERRLDGRCSGIALAATILFGFLSHLTMIEMAATLAIWTAWVIWRRTGRVGRTVIDVGRIFLPSFLVLLPLAVCMVAGARLFGFHIGGLLPFTWAAFAQGYGGLIRYLFGLPSWIGDWTCIGLACGLVCTSAVISRDRRASLYVIGILGLPLVMGMAHLPNLAFPRYFLISGTLLLLWTAETMGRAFEDRGINRLLAIGALGLMLSGSALSLLQFYQYGRGSYAAMVKQMTEEGAAVYASNRALRTAMVIDHFAARTGSKVLIVPEDSLCLERPAWLIIEGDLDKQAQQIDPGCALAYERVNASRHWGLSGLSWTLYRLRG